MIKTQKDIEKIRKIIMTVRDELTPAENIVGSGDTTAEMELVDGLLDADDGLVAALTALTDIEDEMEAKRD